MRVHVHPGVLPLSGPEGAGKNQKVLTSARGPTVRNAALLACPVTLDLLNGGTERSRGGQGWGGSRGALRRARRSQTQPDLLVAQYLADETILNRQ